MINTLCVTVFLEGLIVLGYCRWRRKPLRPILVSSVLANIITQSLLWVALNLAFRQYIPALLVSELLIWFMEGFLLHFIPRNQLNINEALLLSLGMNLTSFALGWFLPA